MLPFGLGKAALALSPEGHSRLTPWRTGRRHVLA